MKLEKAHLFFQVTYCKQADLKILQWYKEVHFLPETDLMVAAK